MLVREMKTNISALVAAQVTEKAAIAASALIGMGDEKLADKVAVDAMRTALNSIDIIGTIVIGEGERDQAPMLYIGEKVGTLNGEEADIAVDPLEGTTICATGAQNSLSVMAIGSKGCLLNAPDVYMDKIAIGYAGREQVINLEDSPAVNLQNLAKVKKCDISDLKVVVLDRPRHKELIAKIREAGSRVYLISDGDIAPVVTSSLENGVDMYMGIGGAPEGVLAAAALSVLNGQMMGRLIFDSDIQKQRAHAMGVVDLNRIYSVNDMVKGPVIFTATGVTDGSIVEGVKMLNSKIITHTLVLDSRDKAARFIKTHHPL